MFLIDIYYDLLAFLLFFSIEVIQRLPSGPDKDQVSRKIFFESISLIGDGQTLDKINIHYRKIEKEEKKKHATLKTLSLGTEVAGI